jgi:hypothetical protein
MAGETLRAILYHVWRALEPLGYPIALIGGTALAAWNHARATRDIDLLIGVSANDFDRVVGSLRAANCRPKSEPIIRSLGQINVAQFLYTPPGEFYDAQFDLWLADSDLYRSALARRVRRELPGVNHPIDVINCDDLILLKLSAGRLIDRADAAMLLRENRDAIDFDYLQAWLERLDLTREFSEIWAEAFPNDPPPVS